MKFCVVIHGFCPELVFKKKMKLHYITFCNNRKAMICHVTGIEKTALEEWLYKSKERLGPQIPTRNRYRFVKRNRLRKGDLISYMEIPNEQN